MKHLYLLFLISLLPILSFGQNEYFYTDSTASIGVQLIDGGDVRNSQFCQVQTKSEIIKYTPYDITEYGFKDGRVYVSKEIQIADSPKRVFLERLYKGNTTLYYYKGKKIKTFFIQKDSTLFVEIPKQNKAAGNYSEQLLNLTNGCANVRDACKLVTYKKNSFTKLIERYNQCVLKPFPHFRYGFLIGYEFLQLAPTINQGNKLGYFDYKYDGGSSIGLFLDNPIQVSDFSVHTEIYFSKHGYSYNHILTDEDLDLIINISSLRVPILLRYSLPKNNFRPYFNTGPIFSYNISNKNALYEASISDNKIEINNPMEEPIISDNEIGYVVGCGLEHKLDYKRSVFFDIRYCRQYGITNDTQNKNSMILISSGINF